MTTKLILSPNIVYSRSTKRKFHIEKFENNEYTLRSIDTRQLVYVFTAAEFYKKFTKG